MALKTHLVEKIVDPGDQVFNGIEACVIVIDDAVETTDTLVRNAAVDKINTELSGSTSGPLPQDYFNKNTLIAGIPAGLDADDDIAVFGKRVLEAIA